jgi:hypothetical protein
VRRWLIVVAFAAVLLAQNPSQPATVKQLMVDLIHPASNDLLLFIYRGASSDEKEWAAVRRAALALAESGNLLTAPSSSNQDDWASDAKRLADVGAAAYQAAQAKDLKTLAALAEPLDRACTTCHQHYRPDVFPRQGGSK